MAVDVTLNAKMRRTGVCGATETLLVHRDVVDTHLKPVIDALVAEGCEIRGDETVLQMIPGAKPATEEDWHTEYEDSIISVKIVADVGEAIAHIEHYGSHHTEAIISEDPASVARFFTEIDSAILLHNASTQFADGGEFGFGGEIGIATGKFHARGPVGVEQLTSFKYLVRGDGADASVSRARRIPGITELPPSAPGMRIGLFGGSFNPDPRGPRPRRDAVPQAAEARRGLAAGLARQSAQGSHANWRRSKSASPRRAQGDPQPAHRSHRLRGGARLPLHATTR